MSNYENLLSKFISNKTEIPSASFQSIEKKLNQITDIINKDNSFKNILIYGQVQSGKTLFFTSLMMKLIEQDSKSIFIVLSNSNTRLMLQTYNRVIDEFKLVNSDVNIFLYEDYKNKNQMIFNSESDIPNIFFALKQEDHLTNLLDLLKSKYPNRKVFIIDDEADVAAVPEFEFKLDYKSISELVKKIILTFERNGVVYFPITATPFDNLAIDDKLLKPQYIICLEKAKGYFGLSKLSYLLNSFDYDINVNVASFIDKENKYYLPLELIYAIITFLVQWYERTLNNNPYKPVMLINYEWKIESQEISLSGVTMLIDDIINGLCDEQVQYILNKYYNTINLTDLKCFFSTINESNLIIRTLNNSINSKQKEHDVLLDQYNKDYAQIIIGCNKVSRGVTFKDLSLCYLYSEIPIRPLSILLQQARWFGYRNNIESNLKLAIPDYFEDYYILASNYIEYQMYLINNSCSFKNIEECFLNFSHPAPFLLQTVKKNYSEKDFHRSIWTVAISINNSYTEEKIFDLFNMNQFNWTLNNGNLVCEFNSLDHLLEVTNLQEEELYRKLYDLTTFGRTFNEKQIIKKNKNRKWIIRLINHDGEKQIACDRKAMHYEDLRTAYEEISIHNYNDEFNDDYFEYFTLDFIKLRIWKYNNYKEKKISSEGNIKTVFRADFINK